MSASIQKLKVVYVNVKIIVEPDADIQEIISECDYEFIHDDIVETEIVDFYHLP